MRKRPEYANGEFYHVYNQGVDKRNIFSYEKDVTRFLECMREFNVRESVGSLYSLTFQDKKMRQKNKLVDIVAYCLNPNHFHFILRQKHAGGVIEFIKRLLGGYTSYFNIKAKRKGPLFGGSYKVKHIKDNDYLLHASAYVNLNNRVHGLQSKHIKSSYREYETGKPDLCNIKFIIDQFGSSKEYCEFAISSLELMLDRKRDDKEISELFIEN